MNTMHSNKPFYHHQVIKFNFPRSTIINGELFICEEDMYDFKINFMDTFDTHHHTDIKVSLLNIVHPSKWKVRFTISLIIIIQVAYK